MYVNVYIHLMLDLFTVGFRLAKEHYDISIASAEGFFVVWL